MNKMPIQNVIWRIAASNPPRQESSMAKLRREADEAKVQKAKEQKVRFDIFLPKLTIFYQN